MLKAIFFLILKGKVMDKERSKFEYLIGKNVKVIVDRKMGDKHPKHGFIYPINYGYIENIISGDGEELDAYILGIFEPINKFEGKCIAIVHRLEEDDDKLVIVPKDKWYSTEQIEALVEFQERFFKHKVITKTDE